MIRKLSAMIFLAVFAMSSSGCVALLAGGGAVLWQGGKVISEERSTSMERGVRAVKATFQAKNIRLTEEVTKKKVTQIRGEDPSGANVNIDVFKTGENSSRLEIRYGLGEKAPAREILDEVKKRL